MLEWAFNYTLLDELVIYKYFIRNCFKNVIKFKIWKKKEKKEQLKLKENIYISVWY